MLRKILAILGGFAAGFVASAVMIMISLLCYPPPPELDWKDTDAVYRFVKTVPIGAFVLVWAGDASASLIAAWTCSIIAGRPWVLGAVILGNVFLVFGVWNFVTIPHPTWFMVLDVLSYLPAALLGYWLARVWFGTKATGPQTP